VKRVPWTVLVIALLAVLIFGSPSARALCLFDRAEILRGEWWRCLTGHLVHFTPSHLLFDVFVFCGSGAIVERRSRPVLWMLLVTAAAAVGSALLFWEPALRFYGGLSGVVMALLTFVGLGLCVRRGWPRLIGVGMLVVFTIKLVGETFLNQPLFVELDSLPIRIVPLAHGVGMATGGVFWGVCRGVAFGWFTPAGCGKLPQLE
jgi:rhomboid family GlyGly-CTERM serine protease